MNEGLLKSRVSQPMKSKWLKWFNIFWLIFVMPVLGLLPSLLLVGFLSHDDFAGRYVVVLLRSVRSWVLPDPYPDFTHVGLDDLASAPVWWIVVLGVFSVSVWSVYYLWRLYARR